MDNNPDQVPTSKLQILLYVLASPAIIGIFAAIKQLYRRMKPTEIEKATALQANWNVAQSVIHEMESMRAVVSAKDAELYSLRKANQQYQDWRNYANRCEKRLKDHKIDAPEFWESGELAKLTESDITGRLND